MLYYTLALLIISAVIGIYLMRVATANHMDILGLVASMLLVFTAVGCLVMIPTAYNWVAAGYQVSIINREYDTAYTQEEIFFASDVIEAVRELKRNRYELNGNLLEPSLVK